MKILLTGSGGMVGKNILDHEKAQQHEFLTPRHVQLDLENYAAVSQYLSHHKPDMIIHAAGYVGGIQANIANPVKFLVSNMDMGRNVILAAKENNVTRLLNLSSSCMYPRNAANPLREELVLDGELEPTNEGYAIAKIVATRLCEYISRENPDLQYKTVIPCNLYGKYDKFSPEHSHMLPAVIKKIHDAKVSNSETVEIWGDGLARREFMYAADLADFIFHAIDNFSNMPQNINAGLGFDYTINDYYAAIAKAIGYAGSFSHDLTKPTGMRQKLIDDTRLKAFGWQHKTSLEQGINETYEYYKHLIGG